jgi:hypothetical protein
MPSFAAAASFFTNTFLEHRWFYTELYPRKEFRLPDILSQEQVIHLLQSIKTPNTNSSLGCFTAPECARRTLRLKKWNTSTARVFRSKSWAARQQRPIHAFAKELLTKWKPITDTTAQNLLF